MGKTWSRRPQRHGRRHGIERNHDFDWRACCATFGHQPHASSCRRDPRECGVKRAYSERESRGRVAVLTELSDMGWRAYRCYWCGLFHLTSGAGDREG